MELHDPLTYCEFRTVSADGAVDTCVHYSMGTVHGFHVCELHGKRVLDAIESEGVKFVPKLVFKTKVL